MRIETIKSSQPTTYTLMRPSIIAHAFTHTHTLSVKATAAAVIVCVKPAAY